MNLLLLSLSIIISFIIGQVKSYPPENSFYATKTHYNLTPTNWQYITPDREICKLIHVNTLLRHGTRAPDDIQIEFVKCLIKRLRMANEANPGAMANKYKSLLEWQPQFSGNQNLLSRGRMEHEFLASDFLKLFEETNFSNPSFTFRISSIERARQSLNAFLSVFSLKYPTDHSAIQINDTLLRFFEQCPRYIAEVALNTSSNNVIRSFRKSRYIREILEEVPNRLNLSNFHISLEELESAWSVAGIEIAAEMYSPLGVLFKEANLISLDFYDDLKSYWMNAYGFPIDYQCACPFLKDLFDNLQQAALNDNAKSAIFQFGHAETILPIIASFGLFRDSEPFSVDSAARLMRKRQFRGFKIAPFAGNIAFQLYKCAGQDPHQVQVLVNGLPVQLPGICDSFLCPLRSLMSFYNQFLSCNFHDICSV